MKDAATELDLIWARCTSCGQRDIEEDVLSPLDSEGILLRQRDGVLKQITLTKPTSVNSAYVIGLRYIKQDGSHAEDLFTVAKGEQIRRYYKGSLQKHWPEYADTHKQQVTFALVENEPAPTTAVNTITQVKK